jgi:hypothetical protein
VRQLVSAPAAASAALSVGHDVMKGRERQGLSDMRSIALYGSKLWWRWPNRYLTAMPVILAIVVHDGFSLNW